MRTRRSGPDHGLALLAALFRGDREAAQALLAEARPADLSQAPLSLYHAAACGGDAEAIRLLHAAGVPLEETQQEVTASNEVINLLGEALSAEQQSVLVCHQGPALQFAAALGHAEAVQALLALGVPPDTSGNFGGGYRTTPLNISLWRADNAGEQAERAAACARALLAAGADVTRCSPDWLRACAEKCPSMARMLLGLLQQRSEAGAYAMPTGRGLYSLMAAAAIADALEPLAHFAARLQQADLSLSLASSVLASAAGTGNLGVLRLAQQAAAATELERSTTLARWLGANFVTAALSAALRAAAQRDQLCAVRFLIEEAGLLPTIEAVRTAAQAGASAALGALLAHGAPEVPAALPGPLWASTMPHHRPEHHYPSNDWPCPVLATLAERQQRDEYLHARRRAGQAVTQWDRKLLPALEQLLAAGYRPAVFANVPVQDGWGGPIVRVQERFDPIVEEDFGLEGCNRWLWLAIQRPDWSPDQHRRFPPAFKAAAAALLLAAHAGSGASGASGARSRRQPGGGGGGGGAAGLASLPREVLLRVVGQAAYPLSAWVGE